MLLTAPLIPKALITRHLSKMLNKRCIEYSSEMNLQLVTKLLLLRLNRFVQQAVNELVSCLNDERISLG